MQQQFPVTEPELVTFGSLFENRHIKAPSTLWYSRPVAVWLRFSKPQLVSYWHSLSNKIEPVNKNIHAITHINSISDYWRNTSVREETLSPTADQKHIRETPNTICLLWSHLTGLTFIKLLQVSELTANSNSSLWNQWRKNNSFTSFNLIHDI